jgi:hypothetical protein
MMVVNKVVLVESLRWADIVLKKHESREIISGYHFLPFASLGLFQYGLLHFGQITGSCSPYFRGNQI